MAMDHSSGDARTGGKIHEESDDRCWIRCSEIRELYQEHPTTCTVLVLSFVVPLVVTAVALIAVSLQRLESDQYGLEYDVHAKILRSKVQDEGLHNGPPGFSFIKYTSTFSSMRIPEDEGTNYSCVSGDGLMVNLTVMFQYLPDMKHLRELTERYRNEGRYRKVVRAAGVSAVNHGCGEFRVNQFQADRLSVQQRMFQYLKTKLEGSEVLSESNNTAVVAEEPTERGMFTFAISLSLENTVLPFRYQEAVAAKQSANEDIALAINQRKQRTTQAQTKLISARTQSEVIKIQAHENAAITIKNAEYKANGTLVTYKKEGEAYRDIVLELGMNVEGFLAYLGTRAVEKSKSPKLSVVEPAYGSYRGEL
eukprot:CAMPEP_0114250618 /NCGR_PEP_ID=MMETSP0058-20121206/14802_1 /TAXON_ID=36894 /ORGANISM="Pyramimonas parkeae, CCMP726" /LENGTH=365 /DNA_ID=CAMNT_0001364303 /DNA_START=228 /DNA_END=1325 /DNA_ORIENTATION=-